MKHLLILLGLFSFTLQAQKPFQAFLIPSELKKNANSVMHTDSMHISIPSADRQLVYKKRVITVLNKNGNKNVNAYGHYSNTQRIKHIRATIYNALGVEEKVFKRKDFTDASTVSGGTLYSDDRVLYLNYTPTTYPYTIAFTLEYETSTTAFIEPWYHIENYYTSSEGSVYEIAYNPELELRFKKFNLNDSIQIQEQPGHFKIKAHAIKAIEPESYSPSFNKTVPNVLFALGKFMLEGVLGEANTWEDFGKWRYNHLIKGLDALPEHIVAEATKVVAGATTQKEKVKRLYQYMQDKTRYISVQLGIGGWKPYPAEEVERLGYGDCKGLTNYTKALLKSQGITSNYAVVWAGSEQKSMDPTFASMQGNHVILNVPLEGEELWLECTNQAMPFNFLGDFTDNRDALLLTPSGGILKRTHTYTTENNKLDSQATIVLNPDGNIEADVTMTAYGIQFDDRFGIQNSDAKQQEKYYKEYWDFVPNIVLENVNYIVDKNEPSITEKIQFKSRAYASPVNENLLLTVNCVNRFESVPARNKNRRTDIEIQRGFTDIDTTRIILPKGYHVSKLPEKITLNTDFGSYTANFQKEDESTLLYTRTFVNNAGVFPKERYAAFRKFRRSVARYDNLKVLVEKNQ